jgi:DNA invertase Pin-like site-specific DNA recombinase
MGHVFLVAEVKSKLDRLTRSVKDLATLMDAFRRARVGFTAIQEAVDTTSASGELFLNIIGALSQWERKAIGERTKAALAHLKAKGQQVSRFAPYGYSLTSGGRLALNLEERAALAEVARLRARGLSLRAISKALAARGILARNGHPSAHRPCSGLFVRGRL